MAEGWDKTSRNNQEQGRKFSGRGRGFSPAVNRPEPSVGRPCPREEPNQNVQEMEYWDDDNNGEIAKVDWSLAIKHEYKDFDYGRGGRGNRNGEESYEYGSALGIPIVNANRSNDVNELAHNSRHLRELQAAARREFYNPSREKRELFKRHKVTEGDGLRLPPYIPQRPTEDDDDIFHNGITTGINFDKYDEIEVKVSGSDPILPVTRFDEAGLNPILVSLIRKSNYIRPTPVQKHAIPIIMSGRDVMACAQTGSGKTAAYLIPMVSKLLSSIEEWTETDNICRPQALIVAPTRELVIQIYHEIRKFTSGTDLRAELCYGGTALIPQIEALVSKRCDFVVGTPGRLLDIMRRGKLVYTNLKFFVFDEADRMLDLGFLPDMEQVMERVTAECTTERQTLMFSATFPEEIQILAGRFLQTYLFIAVGIVGGACTDIEQKIYAVSKFEKRDKLVDLLIQMGNAKALVFVELKRTTDFLATFLSEKNFRATSIHGGREQREREQALEDFKSGRMRILVATSVAARGLDIKNVAHVINYDLPKSIDDYVHRIGRTGRVGNKGSAISFFDDCQDGALAPFLIKVLKQTQQDVPDFLQVYNYNAKSSDEEAAFGGEDVRDSDGEDNTPVEAGGVW